MLTLVLHGAAGCCLMPPAILATEVLENSPEKDRAETQLIDELRFIA